MIHTIVIIICTVINCAVAFNWIRQLEKQYKAIKRKKHLELCSCSIEHGLCPHNCKVCAWGDVMTKRQLNQEKRTKKFLKEIRKYHRRHKHE